jgi:hypothetical protein
MISDFHPGIESKQRVCTAKVPPQLCCLRLRVRGCSNQRAKCNLMRQALSFIAAMCNSKSHKHVEGGRVGAEDRHAAAAANATPLKPPRWEAW